ncbi:hypothetical protein AX774_g8243 [Zancudomyces culisetae]|uniref:Uncharacterized protein n=1 Tax=Zancudomyces culisetae TaxID=1213189 RepID=A0A1R1PBQ4_ZANCU|nr:hypothetical protein AX774_g8243 [Zancudomyces culisetae]|eukprot:OMH78371.1 hypothetical protein AX774_g8243 [Zancudomyces culisetae]
MLGLSSTFGCFGLLTVYILYKPKQHNVELNPNIENHETNQGSNSLNVYRSLFHEIFADEKEYKPNEIRCGNRQ